MANSEVEDKSPPVTPFLVKIYGENVNRKYPLNGPEVTIGRHPISNIRVDSISVSRKHCYLKYEKDAWVLRDSNSQNGTYINGRRLEKNHKCSLRCGDIIFLGPPSENPQAFSFDDYPEEIDHIWTHPTAEKDVSSSAAVSSTQSCECNKSADYLVEPEILKTEKSKVNTCEINSNTSISPKNSVKLNSANCKLQDEAKKNSKNLKNNDLCIPSTSQGISTKSKSLSPKVHMVSQSQQVAENSQSLLDIEEAGLFHQDSYPFSQVLGESSASNNENLKMETGESNKLEIHRKDNDTELLKSKLALLSEKINQLEHSKSSLLKDYVDVCEKNKMLDQQLAEQQKLKDDVLMCEMRVKNKFKSQIMEKLEEELICNICTEVLIQPTVLDCRHTFCEYCISEWKKKKGQCPICRNPIKSMTRILALDHFIDKTLETLTPGQKEKRQELILEREHRKNTPPRTSSARGRRRGRGRRRSSYHRRPIRQSPVLISPQSLHLQRPEIIQLDESVIWSRYNGMTRWPSELLISDTENDSSIEMVDQYLVP